MKDVLKMIGMNFGKSIQRMVNEGIERPLLELSSLRI